MNAVAEAQITETFIEASTTASKLVYAEQIDSGLEHIRARETLVCEAVERATWAALAFHQPYYVWEYNGCILAGGACPDWADAELIHSVEP